MASLNYVQPKSSRNRFSLFLHLSAQRKISRTGISSDSYFADTPTTIDFMDPWTSTSSVAATTKGLFRVNSGASSPLLPRSPMRLETDPEPVPPTTNELDAKEKARLLKKARKLSKVFGEMPEIQRTSTTNSSNNRRSKPPGHRRSMSTCASDPELSSKQQNTRKFSSQSDLAASSSESGSRLEMSDRERIPPVPSLPRESLDASFEFTSAQHLKTYPLLNPTRPIPIPSTDDSVRSSSSPVSLTTPGSISAEKRRLTKTRRNVSGEDKSKTIYPYELKGRKSYDSSVARASSRSDEASPGRALHRSRSLSANKKKKIDNTVEFYPESPQMFDNAIWRRDPGGITFNENPGVPSFPGFIPPDTARTMKPSDVWASGTSGTSSLKPELHALSTTSLQQQHDHGRAPSGGPSSNLDGDIPDTPSSYHSNDTFNPPPPPDSDSNVDESFRERRRRAAKLAQFFGVEYHDLSASMPVTGHALEPPGQSVGPSTSPVANSNSNPNSDSNANSKPTHDFVPSEKWEHARVEPSVQVGIKTNSRRFWGGRGNLKEAEVGDVISKLRELRAS
ncbi:hypothetical protein F5878DRAFT_178484 [Lentinula raphanica]|uniref:Uncharacterized protein n=1 Tax=Lentinula raphanica TaxID=153919 RepID=A0AA38UKF8_9AGAR|nr:hypothetical protein F5878DRAFT_178484 [Lentinula raphanica]